MNIKEKTKKELEEYCVNEDLIYEYMLSKQKDLQLLTEKDRIPSTKVHGCASEVYIKIIKNDNKTILQGYSDSQIITGVLGIISSLISEDSSPKLSDYSNEILALKSVLSQNRRLGFENMLSIIFENK